MKKRIPGFRTEAEEAAVSNKHDSTDFLSELTEDTETTVVRPENGSIEVRPAAWQRLLREARRRRTTPQRLVQRWLQERLTGS